MSWWEDARCRGVNVDAMVPLKEKDSPKRTVPDAHEQFLIDRFCTPCPVREQCLADAVRMGDLGIRGGTILGQRRLLRPQPMFDAQAPVGAPDGYRGRRAVGAPVDLEGRAQHGTHRGYGLGCRCGECRAAHAAANRAWRDQVARRRLDAALRRLSRKPALTGAPLTGMAAGSPEEAPFGARVSSGARPAS